MDSLTLRRLLTLVGAPVIWIVHFVACYVAVSLVCALQLTSTRILGLDLAEFGIAAVTLIAVVMIVGLIVTNLRRWRQPPGPDPDMSRFFAVNTLLLCVLSLLALIWVAFPALLLPACAA